MKLRPFSSSGKRFLRAKHCEGEKRNTKSSSTHHIKPNFEKILNIFLRRMKKQTFHLSSCLFMYVILPFFFAPLDAVCFVVVNKQHTHSLYSGPEGTSWCDGIFSSMRRMGRKTAAAKASTFSSAFWDGKLYIRKNYTYHYKFSFTCVCVGANVFECPLAISR